MADKAQLAAQIRFQLERLSARNAHHEFEHLCRHLARARIAANILPATGPVSAGGDQGRDFETFRSYLAKSPLADRSFVGAATGEVIAFACTTENQKRLVAKIRDDVKTICSSGEKVDAVYAFCTADLPVAKRHEQIEWARNSYDVRLAIIDGNAISESLTDRDVFWIAERYLEIPAEILPAPESKTEYEHTLTKWKAVDNWVPNFANFSEIRAAVRTATFSATQDVPFWVSLLQPFLESNLGLQRQAIYEIAVATLRGLDTLRGQETPIRQYFGAIERLQVRDIEDAGALLMYCIGAVYHDVTDLKLDELVNWRSQLIGRTKKLIQSAASANDKAILLEQRAFLAMVPESNLDAGARLQQAIPWWERLLAVVKEARLFPLNQFARRVNDFIGGLGTDAKMMPILKQLDGLVAERNGRFAAAELARDRAVQLRDHGHVLAAIEQAHAAKIQWYADETIRGSVLTLLFLSEMYCQLSMYLAAKQYALGAAFLVGNRDELQDLFAPALAQAARCDYAVGAFVGYLDLTTMSLRAYAAFSQKATDEDTSELVENTLKQILLLRAVARRVGGDARTLVEKKIGELPLRLEDYYPEDVLGQEPYANQSEDELWNMCQTELDGPQFADLGQTRTIVFSALGVRWQFEWSNEQKSMQAGEEIVAAFQVALVEVADKTDLCFLPTTIIVRIAIGSCEDVTIADVPEGHRRVVSIKVPENPPRIFDQANQQILRIIAEIFARISLLRADASKQALNTLFRGELVGKLFVVRPYREMLERFVPREEQELSRLQRPLANRQFEVKECETLRMPRTLGPGYDERRNTEGTKARYRNVIRIFPFTLARLRGDEVFKATVAALRANGWKDWHILIAVGNAAMNHRVQLRAGRDIEHQKRIMREMWSTPETAADPEVPLSSFSIEKLREHLVISMGSTLVNFGLSMPPGPYIQSELDGLLRARYRYWDFDIPHDDPFAESPPGRKTSGTAKKGGKSKIRKRR